MRSRPGEARTPYVFISSVLGPLNSLLWYVPSSRYIWSSAPILFLQEQIKDMIIIMRARTTGNCAAGQLKVMVYGHFWYVMSSGPPPWSSAPTSTKLVKRLAGGWACMAQPERRPAAVPNGGQTHFPCSAPRSIGCKNLPVITNIPKTWQPPAATVSIGVGREIPGLLNCRLC